MRTTSLLLGLLCGLGATAWIARVQAQPAVRTAGARVPVEAAGPSVELRWQDTFDAFAAADRLHPPAPGGVVFVGSSTIRLWSGLEKAFEDGGTVIVKRGFGGSRLQDCVQYLGRLVLPYAPRLVVVYAGDNDLAEGQSPQQVLQSFSKFVEGVRAALPGTRIAYVSIKPSPLRAALLPQVREANTLIGRYAREVPGLDFIDIFPSMVDASGQPRPELFVADQLHLNQEGYALWKRAIAPYLRTPG